MSPMFALQTPDLNKYTLCEGTLAIGVYFKALGVRSLIRIKHFARTCSLIIEKRGKLFIFYSYYF